MGEVFVLWKFVLLLFLIVSYTNALSSHPPSPSPTSTPISKMLPPARTITPSRHSSTLDPKQLAALRSMNLPTTSDPCDLPFPHNFTLCDSSAPFRHVIGLTLSNCSSELDLDPSTVALRSLSTTLVSLSFLHCHIPPPNRLPSKLRSFSSVSSLRQLTGVYLSRLVDLTDLTVIDVPIQASGLSIVISKMYDLQNLTISNTTLSGTMPMKWKSLNLTHIDLSGNGIEGAVHASIGTLAELEHLDLSRNKLTGEVPDTIANMPGLKNLSFHHNFMSGALPDTLTELPSLVHLDIADNQLNGTLPKFLTEMAGLKYLNLENNNFHGVVPFNTSFIKSLDVLKLGGNMNLCYNHSLLSSKLKLGVSKCDKYGLPISTAPRKSRSFDSDSYSDGGEDDGEMSMSESSDGGSHHAHNKLIRGVVITGLTCLVFLIIFIVCLIKMCSRS